VYTILGKTRLAPKITRYVVRAPDVCRAWRAGQFVIVQPRPESERIPLTVADAYFDRIVLVVREVGRTTAVLADMPEGEALAHVCGPLGEPTPVRRVGTVAVVAGGIGIAAAWPIARAAKAAGNRVISILGARTRSGLILEAEMRRTSDETFVVTEDGSLGEKGLVTAALARVLEDGRRLDLVLAIGPVAMMQAVAELTRPRRIATKVSLNTLMIDGTGMCGGCRVSVSGRPRFVCLDGPEFDAHEVDFDGMMRRQAIYAAQEKRSYEDYLRQRAFRFAARLAGVER
jgi:ferredoxin--NADP+ reductase